MSVPENIETPTAADPQATSAPASKAAKSRWLDPGFTLEQLKTQDGGAWKALITILSRIAESYLRKSFTNPADPEPLTFSDAEELTGEICEEIYQGIAEYNTLDHIEASFRTALTHKAIDRKRKAGAQRRSGDATRGEDSESKQEPKPDPVETALKERVEPFTNAAVSDDNRGTEIDAEGPPEEDLLLRQAIFDCASELKPQERQFVALLYGDQSQQHIADTLGVNVKNITEMKQRIFAKLIPKLRAKLGQRGLNDYGIATD